MLAPRLYASDSWSCLFIRFVLGAFFFFCSVSVCSVAFGLASSLIDCKNVVFVLSMSWSVRILQSHFFRFFSLWFFFLSTFHREGFNAF